MCSLAPRIQHVGGGGRPLVVSLGCLQGSCPKRDGAVAVAADGRRRLSNLKDNIKNMLG